MDTRALWGLMAFLLRIVVAIASDMNYALAIFIAVTLAAPQTTENRNTECGGKPAEIFFLLDSSSSIWNVDFKKQLQFVVDIIENFDVSPNNTRVGVATFSYRYREYIPLNIYDNKKDVQTAVKNIRQTFGGTSTFDALDGVRTRGLSKAKVRPDVVRIAIVLTDGESSDADKTKTAAQKLKAEGVIVFAIGIGSQTDEIELKTIASEPSDEYLFQVGNYGLLETIKDKFAVKACAADLIVADPTAPPPICGATNLADVMFIVDSPDIGVTNSQKIYSFIENVTNDFSTETGNIKIGLETRHCSSNDIALDRYDETTELAEAFRNTRVKGLSHMIKRLRTHAYKEKNGGRIYARHMAVIFVDNTLFNPKEVLEEARRAKIDDVEVFVVAIGDKVNLDELRTMCSSSVNRHLLVVPSYEALGVKMPDFMKKFCVGL